MWVWVWVCACVRVRVRARACLLGAHCGHGDDGGVEARGDAREVAAFRGVGPEELVRLVAALAARLSRLECLAHAARVEESVLTAPQQAEEGLAVRGRCVGDAWEMRGRCMGDAWSCSLGHIGLQQDAEIARIAPHY